MLSSTGDGSYGEKVPQGQLGVALTMYPWYLLGYT